MLLLSFPHLSRCVASQNTHWLTTSLGDAAAAVISSAVPHSPAPPGGPRPLDLKFCVLTLRFAWLNTMKNNSAGDVPVVAKLPFYQKVLNTFGSSPSTRKAEEPLASSPFRRGYTRTTPIITRSTPVVVVPTTPTTPVSCQAAHKSAASSIFRSFRRRSLRRSFRRTKSFLVKNPVSPTPNAVVAGNWDKNSPD